MQCVYYDYETDTTHSGERVSSKEIFNALSPFSTQLFLNPFGNRNNTSTISISENGVEKSLLTKRVHPNVLYPSHNTNLSFTTQLMHCVAYA